ncbi:AMP-binding protein [Rhizobium sp. TRM95111]|uniref:AMP-binding protein n=1 Tax=Rhizobium alarense TaxID=2846851 RepID=UPI001F48D634|nr:AMP-binding protein [Rhizobium alarense]MCF3642173.1 AMP-binding protein [Rhizobium alarense]
MAAGRNLSFDVYHHARENPDLLALSVAGTELTYGDLAGLARRLAGVVRPVAHTGRVGILASRSLAACAGILGTAWSGGTYVPLNLKLPEERLVMLLETLALDALVVDARGAAMITERVRAVLPSTVVLADDARLALDLDGIVVQRLGSLPEGGPAQPAAVDADHLAYIEFTSGTTGVPKGVMVPVGAVNHYMDVMQAWFGFRPDDRAAETCDITFDLSVHNMFLTWQAGASLHVMTPLQMVAPARFIRDRQITTWLSVPSIIAMMRQNRTLEAGSLPSLRISMFCGEPLPVGAARAWAEAAPDSRVENIYGPTEATIACLRQPVVEPVAVTPKREIVAIGAAYPGMRAAILDGEGRQLPAGTPGEIALSGAQLATGYFGQPDLTAARFPVIDGVRWYLTGDLGMTDADGLFHHLGRIDNQVKVLGNRVELEEVEMYLRAASGSDHVAAVAWPATQGSATGIVGFAVGAAGTPDAIRAALRERLPAYMVPGAVHLLDDLPLNANGKVDRKALFDRLERGLVPEAEGRAA